MTVDDLRLLLEGTRWFSNLGDFPEQEGYVALQALDAWGASDPGCEAQEAAAAAMIWLPSSRDEPDPFGGPPSGVHSP